MQPVRNFEFAQTDTKQKKVSSTNPLIYSEYVYTFLYFTKKKMFSILSFP